MNICVRALLLLLVAGFECGDAFEAPDLIAVQSGDINVLSGMVTVVYCEPYPTSVTVDWADTFGNPVLRQVVPEGGVLVAGDYPFLFDAYPMVIPGAVQGRTP